MNIEPDQKASDKWEKSQKSYENYLEFIKNKKEKFKLELIDLLFISNFKGGNASIHEKASQVDEKLLAYSEILKDVNKQLENKKLNTLNNDEIKKLIDFANKIMLLTTNPNTKIDGFNVSYLTALLNFYFPDLYPILDRRVLNGLALISKENLIKSSGQVKNLHVFYPILLTKFKELSAHKTLRELDKQYFSIKFDYNALPDSIR